MKVMPILQVKVLPWKTSPALPIRHTTLKLLQQDSSIHQRVN